MTILAFPGGANGTTFTPSAGFSVVNGVWLWGWDDASGNGDGPVKAIAPQPGYVVPNWNPATIVDTTTSYGIAAMKTVIDSNLANAINDSSAGIVLIDGSQNGIYMKLIGDDSGSNGLGFARFRIIPLTAGVEGSAVLDQAVPTISDSTVQMDARYNPLTKEVVVYINSAYVAKYNYTSAPANLRIGIGAYKGGGSWRFHTAATTSYNAIPYLKAKYKNDTDLRINTLDNIGGPVVAATGDYLITEITYVQRDDEPEKIISVLPTWNGQTFTRIGTRVSSVNNYHEFFYLKVTSGGSANPVADITTGAVSGDYVNCGASLYVYGGVGSDTIGTPLLQNIVRGNTYAAPSLAYTGMAMYDIGVDLLALSGYDLGDNNQTLVPMTQSANQYLVDSRQPTATNPYGGSTWVGQLYANGTASWTSGSPPLGYGGPNAYANVGFILKAATPGSDTTPDTFTFTAATNVALSTVSTSNTITVSGIDATTAISISGGSGTYSKNGGAYTSTAGTVVNGDTVSVRVTSSASNSTLVSTTLTIGGVTGTYNVTTVGATDTTPDAFTLTAQTGAALSTVTTSNTITVAGINAATAISISGSGTYSKNGGAYTASAGTVVNGDTVTVRITSSSSNSTAVSTTLTIGGVTSTFTVTTLAAGGSGATPVRTVLFTGTETYTLTGSFAAGDLITLQYSTDANAPGTPSGFTAHNSVYLPWDGQYVGLMYKLAVGNETGTTIAFGRDTTVIMTVWTNVNQTAPVFGWTPYFASGDSPAGTINIPIPSLTTNSANSVVVAGGALDLAVSGATINYTAPTGFTQLNQVLDVYNSLAISYKLQAAAAASGAVTYPVTTSVNAGPGGFLYSIQSGSGGGSDTTPDAFSFTSATGVNPSTTSTSGAITVAGIDTSTAISITGGMYSKNGGAFTSSAGTVVAGDTVSVQVTSSASYSTGVTATLTIGGVNGTYTATTRAADVTPDVWTFTPVTGAALSTVTTSTTVNVTGIDAGQSIGVSVTGGSATYSKNGGAYTATAGTVQLNDTVTVRITSSATYNTQVSTTLNIGAVSVAFNVTTRAVDTTPDNFSFTTASGVALSTLTESNAITVAGVDSGQNVAISVSGGEYAISTNGGTSYGAFTTSAGNVQLGYLVKVRNTSSASTNTTVTTTLTIGGVSGTFSTVTGTPDTTPDAFTFNAQTAVNPSTAIDSNAITIAGVTAGVDVAITVTGGQYAVSTDGGSTYGSFTSAAGNVRLGYLVKARVTSSASYLTAASTTVTIGGVGGTFTATTRAIDTTPNAFTFASITNADTGSTQTSASITVAGIDTGATPAISISGGGSATYSKNGGAYTSTAGTVVAGDVITVRQVASNAAATALVATLTIGGVSGTFSVTTATPALTAVGNGTVAAGQTGVTLTTTGFGAVTSVTIGGVAATALAGSNGSWTITAPDMVDGADFPLLGSAIAVVISNGTATASRNITFTQRANQGTATLTSVPATSIGYLGYYSGTLGAAIGDPVFFDTAATLATASGQTVPLNGVDVDGRIFSDYSGVQTMYLRKASTGKIVAITVTTPALADTTPDAFNFTTSTSVALGAVSTSNAITVAGINSAAAISITGGTYSINGGAYTSTAGTVTVGQTVTIRVTASATPATDVTATLTIGGVVGTYTATTVAVDTTPDAFTFTAATNVAQSTVSTSNTITVSGINSAANISISGGSGTYSKNGGAYTSTAGTVVNGDTVTVRVTSSASFSTAVSTTLTIGGVTGTYTATTLAIDTTPDVFSFASANNVTQGSTQTSAAITVSGINSAANISITNGTYSINGGAYTASAGTVTNGQTVTVRVVASASAATTVTASLTIGGVTGTYAVSTVGADTTPDAFSFTSATNAEISTVTTSASITVAGINTASNISISGGTYSVNGGAYTSTAGTVNLNDTVTVRVTSSASYNTAATATLIIGGVSGTYTVTTRVADTTPNAFSFTAATNAAVSTLIESTPVTVAGVDSGVDVAITVSGTGATYAISSDGGSTYGSYTASAGVVRSGYFVKTRITSSASFSTAVTSTVTIGGVSGGFTVTTAAQDTTPDNFSFTATNNAALGSTQTSAAITVAGINSAAAISISNGTYSIDGGAYTASAGTVNNGQSVTVRVVASATPATGVTATLTIGGVTANYVVTTVPADIVPDAFSFTAVTGAEISTATTSGQITVAGINAASAISISGGTYSINGGSYVSTAGTVNVNDTVRVRVTSNAAYNAAASTTLTIGGVTGTFSVTTRAADLTPDALTFTAVTGAALSTATVSNNATIAGIDAGQNVAISITGGQYAISTNGGTSFGAYTASAGNVQLGHVVRIQVTSSASNNTPVTATLTVGGVASAFVVTTASANDTTPDAFTFNAQTAVNPAVQVESNAIVVAGVTSGIDVPISITGGQFAIDSGSGYGAFTSTATVIRLGWSVKVRVTTSSSFLTAASTTLTIGGVTGQFTATTRAADTTPNAFTFTPATGAETNTVTTSNSITVTGVDAAQNVVVMITGGTYSVNGGTYTSLSTNVVLNDVITVRVTSSTSYSTAASATLDVGGVTGAFSVTTRAVDTTPSAFTFASVGGATQGATVESASITVAGVDSGVDVAISVSNGEYAVNTGSGFGAFTASAGVVRLGHVVKVRAVAASSANTDTVAVLTIGGITGSFTVSTGVPDDTVPDAFSFTAVTNASISTSYDSAAVTIAGVTSGVNVPVSIVGGTYSINTGSGFGAFTSSPGNIQLGQQIKVRVGTGSAYNTTTTATLTIGTVPGSFAVTTRVADTTPDAFTLTAVTGATPSTVYTSSVVAVAGVDAGVDVPITITGTGTYAIDPGTGTYGSYVNTPGVVRLGYNVKVRLTSSNLGDTTVTSTLSIGGVTGVYSVNTGTIDTVPDAYSFTAVTNAEANTVTESSVIQIAGVSAATDVAISITGGSYSINSGSGFGAFVTAPGVVRLGYSVKVRLTTGSAYATANTATLSVGGVTGAFVVTTRAADLTPNTFSFTAATAVNPSTATESSLITVAGVDAAQDVAISISGGSYAINTGSGFGSFTTSPGVVRLGHIVKVRVTSSSSFNTPVSTTLTIGGVAGTFTATTREADTTPNQFSFAPVLSAAVSSLYESNVITVTGVDAGVDVQISNMGGAWLSNDGSGWSEPTVGLGVVRLGYLVKMQITSPSTVPATESGYLSIGGVGATYSVSTSATDITPDAFTFNAVTDAPLSTAFFSNTITVTGIDAGQRVPISVQGGQYRITSAAGVDGPWQFTASTIALNDKVTVYCSSGAAYGATSNATLTISGVAGIFAVTTRVADTTPRALVFNPLTNALVSTVYESNVNVISAVDPGVDIAISITGGEYAIAVGSSFGAYTAESGIIQGGQSVKVRLTSSANESTAKSATLTVGDVTGIYTVTTRAPAEGNVDIIPDPFTLVSVTNAAMNTTYTSNIITVTDITEGISIPISVTGATFYIDAGNGFGAQLTSSSTVKLGYRVKLAVRSSNYFETAINATLNIGGVVGVYSVTTRPPKITPAPIVLPSIVNAAPNTLYTSTQAAITGIETGATATLSTVNGLEYAINRGAGYESWTTQSTQVKSTDLIKTRLRSATTAGTSKIGKLVIASVVNNFTIYNK